MLVALPIEIIERTYNARNVNVGEEGEETEAGADLDFRGMLKAACMRVRLPIQLMWPTTFDPAYKIPRKLKETSDRRTQDPATIAWNLLTATYHKAGGLPWRLARDARQLRTSFVGLSFYRSVDGDHVHTSTAQMFDERGEGLILRGGRMVESEEDRKPHLTAEDAFDLLRNSLRVFRDQHGHWPARVVLHKTSKFDRNELDGFHKAIDERDIDYADGCRLGLAPTGKRRLLTAHMSSGHSRSRGRCSWGERVVHAECHQLWRLTDMRSTTRLGGRQGA